MYTAKKKMDEKNLKTLRELLALPENKRCFDCNQMGPTYVNVTIGSFVCTTCSGMLRGLTPPHRVKSISMASFTPEEMEFITARGNQYCKRVWLALCDTDTYFLWSPPGVKDDQIKDYMINVYEKKRYYMKPSEGDSRTSETPEKELKSTIPKLPGINSSTVNGSLNNNNVSTNNKNNNFFPTDASGKNDPFSSIGSSFGSQPVDNFANFDDNPVFTNSTPVEDWNPFMDSSSLSNFPVLPVQDSPWWESLGLSTVQEALPPPAPSEDRYAALKDLDCLMKSQMNPPDKVQSVPSQGTDWGQNNVAWAPAFDNVPCSNDFQRAADKSANPFSTLENGWNNTRQFKGNPFKTDAWTPNLDIVPNGAPFTPPRYVWDFQPSPNPFSQSNGLGQSQSSNPFL